MTMFKIIIEDGCLEHTPVGHIGCTLIFRLLLKSFANQRLLYIYAYRHYTRRHVIRCSPL